MAHVTFPPFIQSVSGRVGNLFFRTTPSGKTTIYAVSKLQRTSLPTENEMRARELFKQRVQQVNNIIKNDPKVTKAQAWKIVKQIPT